MKKFKFQVLFMFSFALMMAACAQDQKEFSDSIYQTILKSKEYDALIQFEKVDFEELQKIPKAINEALDDILDLPEKLKRAERIQSYFGRVMDQDYDLTLEEQIQEIERADLPKQVEQALIENRKTIAVRHENHAKLLDDLYKKFPQLKTDEVLHHKLLDNRVSQVDLKEVQMKGNY